MHFLEWSTTNNAFYIYEDLDDSGYGVKDFLGGEVKTSGKDTLQVNGGYQIGGWDAAVKSSFDLTNADSWWRSDKSIGEISANDFEKENQFDYTAST